MFGFAIVISISQLWLRLSQCQSFPLVLGLSAADMPEDVSVIGMDATDAGEMVYCGQVDGNGHQMNSGTSTEAAMIWKLNADGKLQK